MDSKFYVSYEVARLLKEKGYDEGTDYIIDEDNCMMGSRFLLNSELPIYICSCPTKAEAIDWLESKGIVVIVYYCKGEWLSLFTPLLSEIEDKLIKKVFIRESFPTRLEAEEAAIIKALEILNTRPTF
jgi:hypothetical protein